MTAAPGDRSREHLALGGALGLHLLVLVLMARTPPGTLSATGGAQPSAPLELSTDWMEAPELPSTVPAASAPSTPGAGMAVAVERAPAGSLPHLAGESVLALPAAPSASAAQAELGDWSFSATRVDTDVGIARFRGAPGATSASGGAHGADTASAAAESGLAATNALLEGITAHDIAAGTSRGGPVLAAVEEAAHGADAPSLGTAVFDITVAKNGAPQVSLVEANRDAASWNTLGSAIAALTAKRQGTVHLPDGARGLRVRVRVEAVDRLSDGADVSRYAKGARNEAHAGGTLERTGKLEDLPHAEFSTEGKICNAHAGVDLLGPYVRGGCSPENGLPARRTVAARIVSETRL
jgi:hypothetical protein